MKEALDKKADRFAYSYFVVKSVPYYPHYKNKDLFVGPDGKEYHKDRFARTDAKRMTGMFWIRSGRMQEDRILA